MQETLTIQKRMTTIERELHRVLTRKRTPLTGQRIRDRMHELHALKKRLQTIGLTGPTY